MLFVTNSSVSTRAQHAAKIKTRLGLDFCIEEDSIFTAAGVAAEYLAKELNEGTANVYVMGLEGIQKELQSKGFRVTVAPAQVFENISAVVVGFDPTFSYNHIAAAMKIFALNPSCLFVGCNLDSSYVNESGFLAPGTGTLVTAVAYASGRKPIIMGKPNNLLFDTILMRW
jgi:HAD superfamily hydrolase (TIGR01450 family)